MSKFEHSFEKVYEALITRATTGCFQAGDVVTFDMKNIQKHDAYKSLTNNLKTRLDDMMRTSENGESVIVVTDTILGCCSPKSYQPSSITIAYSQGGGRWVEAITIPGALTEFMNAVEAGVNLIDKIPSTCKIVHPMETKAEEVNLDELEKARTKGHASSTIHGESVERTINFEVGKIYQSDSGSKSKYECIKLTPTHITLMPIDGDKKFTRKINQSYNPQRKMTTQYAVISKQEGCIDSNFLSKK